MHRFKCFNAFSFLLIFIIIRTNLEVIPGVRTAVVRQQPFFSAIKICRQETGATDADYAALLKRSKTLSMSAKCMRACLMKQFSLMNDDGKFNREVALSIVGELAGTDSEKMRIATEIVDACYTMAVSDNHCEAAEQYGKCANKQARSRELRSEK